MLASGSGHVAEVSCDPRRAEVKGQNALAIQLDDPLEPVAQAVGSLSRAGPVQPRYACLDFGCGNRREKQPFAAHLEPCGSLPRNSWLPGRKGAQYVSIEQPTRHRSASRGGDLSRSTSMVLGIPIKRAAKDGRSVGYRRRAAATGTTTAAGFPRFVIVVASPCSAASMTADSEALAARSPNALKRRTPCNYSGYIVGSDNRCKRLRRAPRRCRPLTAA